jgi:hypothetical protein
VVVDLSCRRKAQLRELKNFCAGTWTSVDCKISHHLEAMSPSRKAVIAKVRKTRLIWIPRYRMRNVHEPWKLNMPSRRKIETKIARKVEIRSLMYPAGNLSGSNGPDNPYQTTILLQDPKHRFSKCRS